jgi:hypothetical protein
MACFRVGRYRFAYAAPPYVGERMDDSMRESEVATLAVLLRDAGLDVEVEGMPGLSWVKVLGRDCYLTVEGRPAYCDRGNWIVKAFLKPGKTVVDLSIDSADGFPRYYFGTACCASEITMWLQARGQR